MRRVRDHIRSNFVAYVALVLLAGSASALQGRNTVYSDDIVDGEVKKPDLGANAVSGEKIRDGEIGNTDLALDAVSGTQVVNESLGGADVTDESVTGVDVDIVDGSDIAEDTLGEVPEARVAGRGRSAEGGTCNPETAGYVSCAAVSIELPAHGRLFVHGFGNGRTEANTDLAFGDCALYTSATGGYPYTVRVNADDTSGGEFGISIVTDPIGPGTVSVEVHCNELAPPGGILYRNVGVSAFQIGPS